MMNSPSSLSGEFSPAAQFCAVVDYGVYDLLREIDLDAELLLSPDIAAEALGNFGPQSMAVAERLTFRYTTTNPIEFGLAPDSRGYYHRSEDGRMAEIFMPNILSWARRLQEEAEVAGKVADFKELVQDLTSRVMVHELSHFFDEATMGTAAVHNELQRYDRENVPKRIAARMLGPAAVAAVLAAGGGPMAEQNGYPWWFGVALTSALAIGGLKYIHSIMFEKRADSHEMYPDRPDEVRARGRVSSYWESANRRPLIELVGQ